MVPGGGDAGKLCCMLLLQAAARLGCGVWRRVGAKALAGLHVVFVGGCAASSGCANGMVAMGWAMGLAALYACYNGRQLRYDCVAVRGGCAGKVAVGGCAGASCATCCSCG